jgi:DNA-binding NtrC family response regulator
MIVAAPCMQMLLDQAARIGPSKASVLIEGESGTGKELLARCLHALSPRRGKALVGVNCAALSESLVESELFGHEKGAFTGAEESRPGRFERAHGGTLLLDEISEMPPKMQAKLLRVLEEEEVERVGGARVIKIDVRVIATTNRSLAEECTRDQFRRDLFYRLNAVHLQLPPLRSRREEIVPLAQHFFERFRHEAVRPLTGISCRALHALAEHAWPGNVRELRNIMQRACILAEGPEIQPGDLALLEAAEPRILRFPAQTLDAMEKQMILQALRDTRGNKTAAAQRLGITVRTLQNKLKRYLHEDAA